MNCCPSVPGSSAGMNLTCIWNNASLAVVPYFSNRLSAAYAHVMT